MYTLKIKDKDGIYINEITNWIKFSYWFELNRPGGTTINLNVDMSDKFTKANLAAGKSYLDIFRYNSKVWSGLMLNPSGFIGETGGNLTLNFAGYLWLLRKINVSADGKEFTDTEQGTILWTLIDEYQNLPNGNFGITEGSITTGVTRNRTYKAFKNIYNAFLEMSEVINGPDFEITSAKVLNVYASKGKRLAHVFEYGKNIKSLNFNFDINDFANCVYAVGSGEEDQLLYSVAHNIQSQEEYGMLQEVKLHPDVILKETLTEHARNYVNEFSEQTEIYSAVVKSGIDPPLFGYNTGDEIRLIIKKGFFDIDTYKRIKKINITVNDLEVENVRVDFQ